MTATIDETADLGDGDGERDGAGGIRHRGLILTAIAVVLVGAVVPWLLAFSSVFGVGSVAVRGTHELTADEVRAAARVPAGEPLLRLDTGAITRRVEALPDVASAQVTTSFPSTVTIAVTERTAVGVVASGSGFKLVDTTGDQFRAVDTRPPHLPLLVITAGSGPADPRVTASAVATVAAALPAGVRARIDSIQALDPQTITLVLNSGRVVRWGSVERTADKARVLSALLQVPGSQLDVTDPDQPFVR